jgi:hypothetical protein
MDLRESPREAARLARRHSLIRAAVVGGVGAALALGFWKESGRAGLLQALLGMGLGAGIAAVGQLLRRRALLAEGHAVISAMLLATFMSFALFIALALFTVFLFRAAAVPVLLGALGIYLAVTFHEAIAAQGRSTRR